MHPDRIADAKAEVNERRQADEEADDGVEAFQGDDSQEAEAAAVRDGIAEERVERGEEGGHGGSIE